MELKPVWKKPTIYIWLGTIVTISILIKVFEYYRKIDITAPILGMGLGIGIFLFREPLGMFTFQNGWKQYWGKNEKSGITFFTWFAGLFGLLVFALALYEVERLILKP